MMTASYENHTFSETVYAGTVSHELLKPQPVVIGPIGENLAIRIWLTLIGMPVVVLAGFALGASFQARHLPLCGRRRSAWWRAGSAPGRSRGCWPVGAWRIGLRRYTGATS